MTPRREVMFPDIGAFVANAVETTLLADASAELHKIDESGDRRPQGWNHDWASMANQIVGAETL